MDEPRRLRQMPLNTLERAVLDAGARKVSVPETRARTLAALGLAGSATLIAAGAAASGSFAATSAAGKATLLGALWTKIAVGISLVGVGTAVPIGYYALRDGDGTRDPAPLVAAAPARPPATPGLTGDEPVPAAAPAETARQAAAQASLTRELVALDAARTLLARGDAKGALILLERYARLHPNGRMGIEAEVLRIDALARDGQKEAARRRADAFLERLPNSLLAPRVRAHAGR